MVRVLLIDDDADFSDLLGEALREHGHDVRCLDDPEVGLPLLTGGSSPQTDVVLLDQRMPRQSGLEFLGELRRRGVYLPVVLLTNWGSADVAIRAAQLGALHYLPKPDNFERGLRPLLGLLAEVARSPQGGSATAGAAAPDVLLGDSEPMRRLYQQIGQATLHELPVLLHGETGTGKELAARYLVNHSARADRPLLRVSRAAYGAALEEEFFGTEGAPEGGEPFRGLFVQAAGGAIVLDQLAALQRPAQARLLRLIREGVVQRRGARPQTVDVRVLACTSESLPDLLAAGRLDPELYYHLLAGAVLHLPPLRERGADVQLLADHFLLQATAARGSALASTFHPQARERLQQHPWPGNVRELHGVVRQAVLACRGAEIGPADLDLGARPEPRPPAAAEGRLPPSREKAYQLFRWALERDPTLADRTDAEVFRWLREDPRVGGEGLPADSETFKRYLREARAHYHDPKHTPRAGRPLGRSVVRAGQL